MKKYSYEVYCSDGDVIRGIEEDETFDTREAAEEAALYVISCIRQGAEIEFMSSYGDYPEDDSYYDEQEYEIVEVDE